MHVEFVDTLSLLELQVCGAFDGCTAEDRRAILVWPLREV
jgi:hypothetical protein